MDQASHQSQCGPVRQSKDPDSALAWMFRQIPSNHLVVVRLARRTIVAPQFGHSMAIK
jgi:hypothetical protein